MEPVIQKQCPKCKAEVSEMAYFCSNCGRALRPRPEDTSVSKQMLIYFVSFFLAPFGLGYTFKYLNQPDKRSKTIGAISLVLTLLAIAAVILISKIYLQQEYSSVNLIINSGL